MNKFFKKGFTLMELLVVVSIMGILIALGTVSYTTAQKKSRDAKRKGDLRGIQNALEQCYAVSTAYPVLSESGGRINSANITCPDGTTITLDVIPTDPKDSLGYILVTSDASTYQICADLEGATFTGSEQDYCVSQLQ